MIKEIYNLSTQELTDLIQECKDLLEKRLVYDKIKENMKSIAQECKKADCDECPLGNYCSAIAGIGLPLPDEWELK